MVMYENQTWLPVASLFGLIGCSIPRSLKAEILSTLAAFARSPEIAGSMWHTLEMAQVRVYSSVLSITSSKLTISVSRRMLMFRHYVHTLLCTDTNFLMWYGILMYSLVSDEVRLCPNVYVVVNYHEHCTSNVHMMTRELHLCTIDHASLVP